MRPGTRSLVALATALLATSFAAAADAGEGPHVAEVSGDVEIGRGEPPAWTPARAGDALAAGDAVRTGHSGRAELALGSGTVRLYGDSLLRLPAAGMGAGGAEEVRLDRGQSLFDVHTRGAGDRFEVHTPEVVVSVRGTRFAVDVSEWARVAVYRGLVGLRGTQGEFVHETLVREGFAAVGGGTGPFELSLLDATDPWEAWGPGARLPEPSARMRREGRPARLAVEGAERAARDAYRPAALEAAAARRPEVAERVAELARGGGPAGLEGAANTGDRAAHRQARERDAALDKPRRELREGVEVPFAEAWLASQVADAAAGGGMGSTTAPDDLPFEISLLDGPGPDRIEIRFEDGQAWAFSASTLESFLANGSALPPTFDALLQQQGITDPAAVVQVLLQLVQE